MTKNMKMRKMMRLTVSFMILILGLTSYAVMAEVPKADKKEITNTLHSYIKALRDADFFLLQTCLSDNYFQNHGGKEGWKQKLKRISSNYMDVSVRTVQIIPVKNKPGEYWGKIIFRNKGRQKETTDHNWYLLSKDSKGLWKIDEFFADFDPNKLDPKVNPPNCEDCGSEES